MPALAGPTETASQVHKEAESAIASDPVSPVPASPMTASSNSSAQASANEDALHVTEDEVDESEPTLCAVLLRFGHGH